DPLFQHVIPAAGLEHHDVMVAAQSDELSGIAQLQELLEDAARVGATVDIIAQSDELVLRTQRDRLQQSLEDGGVPMDVADGKIPHNLPRADRGCVPACPAYSLARTGPWQPGPRDERWTRSGPGWRAACGRP